MKTQKEFYSEISEYVLTLKNKRGDNIASVSTRTKREKILKDIVLVLISHGHEYPDEKDYEEYRASRNISDETFEDYREKIEQFFSWSKERSQKAMTQEAILEAENVSENEPVLDETPSQVETETVNQAEPESNAVQVEGEGNVSKAGRKRFDTQNGEKRNQKLMLYLTPRVIADVRDWCRLKGISAVNYITGLIIEDMKGKQGKLNSFRQLSDDA